MYSNNRKTLLFSAQIFFTFCLIIISVVTHAEVVLIVNKENPVSSINSNELKKLYLGKTKSFPNGEKAKPLELAEGKAREEFLSTVLLKSESNLKAYWSRMIFSGKGIPPHSYRSTEELIKAIVKDTSAIGFIDSSKLDETVKVIALN